MQLRFNCWIVSHVLYHTAADETTLINFQFDSKGLENTSLCGGGCILCAVEMQTQYYSSSCQCQGEREGVRYLLIIISRTLSHIIIIIIGEKYILKSLFLNENMAEKECWNKYDHLTLKSNLIHGDPILCRMEILRENTVEISFFEIHFWALFGRLLIIEGNQELKIGVSGWVEQYR